MEEQLPQQRRRRRSAFVRSTDNLPPFRPGPRDADIVQYVHDFRFLTSAHLVALTGGDKTSVEKRLLKLWQHEFLDRRWDASSDPLKRGPAVYELARKGAQLLAQVSGKDPAEVDWKPRRSDVRQPFLQHALMVSHIRTVLTVAARSRHGVDLVFWRHDKETTDRVPIGDDPIYNGVRAETWPIVPDAFFGIRLPGNKAYYCMLEADRSTMDHQDFLRKLRTYFLWWKAGKHTQKFGIKHFIVLTVTLSGERAKNLFQLSRQADDYQRGFALFWFTTLQRLTLEQPLQALGDIWLTWDHGRPTRAALLK